MSKFKFIYEDENRFTLFDRYFDYLRSVKNNMPETLYKFASDVKRYEILGEKTLHDARINNLNIIYQKDNEYLCKVLLCLELADLDNQLNLEYLGVTAIHNSFEPEFWPNQPVDLLTHEFTVLSNGLFKHVIEFDRGVWFDITFSLFNFTESR